MVSNQTGPLLYLVSHREPSLALLFSLHINDIIADMESEIRLLLMTVFAIVKLRTKMIH